MEEKVLLNIGTTYMGEDGHVMSLLITRAVLIMVVMWIPLVA